MYEVDFLQKFEWRFLASVISQLIVSSVVEENKPQNLQGIRPEDLKNEFISKESLYNWKL